MCFVISALHLPWPSVAISGTPLVAFRPPRSAPANAARMRRAAKSEVPVGVRTDLDG